METVINEEYQKIIDNLVLAKEEGDTVYIDEAIYALTKIGARPKLSNEVENFIKITNEMAKTYSVKNQDYGNSFEQSLNEFGLVAASVRISDKMNRIKSLTKKPAQVKDESINDTLLDMATYCVMTISWLNKSKD